MNEKTYRKKMKCQIIKKNQVQMGNTFKVKKFESKKCKHCSYKVLSTKTSRQIRKNQIKKRQRTPNEKKNCGQEKKRLKFQSKKTVGFTMKMNEWRGFFFTTNVNRYVACNDTRLHFRHSDGCIYWEKRQRMSIVLTITVRYSAMQGSEKV